MDWQIVASCVTALAAVVALFISCRQITLSNKQSLLSGDMESCCTGLYLARIGEQG